MFVLLLESKHKRMSSFKICMYMYVLCMYICIYLYIYLLNWDKTTDIWMNIQTSHSISSVNIVNMSVYQCVQ